MIEGEFDAETSSVILTWNATDTNYEYCYRLVTLFYNITENRMVCNQTSSVILFPQQDTEAIVEVAVYTVNHCNQESFTSTNINITISNITREVVISSTSTTNNDCEVVTVSVYVLSGT